MALNNPESDQGTPDEIRQEYRERAALTEREKVKVNEEKERAKLETKFFSLDIGDEALVFIDVAKTEFFKGKVGKNQELQMQVRYFLEDLRGEEPIPKTWDTFPNVAEQVNTAIAQHGKLILMRCHRGRSGGKNFRAWPETEIGKDFPVNIAELQSIEAGQ